MCILVGYYLYLISKVKNNLKSVPCDHENTTQQCKGKSQWVSLQLLSQQKRSQRRTMVLSLYLYQIRFRCRGSIVLSLGHWKLIACHLNKLILICWCWFTYLDYVELTIHQLIYTLDCLIWLFIRGSNFELVNLFI